MVNQAELERRVMELEAQVQVLKKSLASQQTPPTKTGQETVGLAGSSMPLITKLKQILNFGFAWSGNKVDVKPKPSYGIAVDADGVGLKKQAAISSASSVSAVIVSSGADQINLSDLNSKLSTNATQLNAVVTTVNQIIIALHDAEVTE